jgi:hypothetical protein
MNTPRTEVDVQGAGTPEGEPAGHRIEGGTVPSKPVITRFLILDRGALEVGVPNGWLVRPELGEAGEVVVKDADNLIQLEVPGWPTGLPDDLTIERFLTNAVVDGGLDLIHGPSTGDRGDHHFTWIEDVFDAPDQDRLGAVRKAHCRWYLCTNGSVTGQVRFFYWHDDASWAVPTWRTIIGTVRLGSLPLASPFDHWSLKAPD